MQKKFASGESIRISTLNICRGYEDQQRGDKEEGKLVYSTGDSVLSGTYKTPFNGISGEDMTDCVISGTIDSATILDAYVLCTSMNYNPFKMGSFGYCCVKIDSPLKLAYFLTKKIRNELGDVVGKCEFQPVIYDSIYFAGDKDLPGPIGFVKNKEIYFDQREYRFIWFLKKEINNLGYIDIQCEELSEFCKLF